MKGRFLLLVAVCLLGAREARSQEGRNRGFIQHLDPDAPLGKARLEPQTPSSSHAAESEKPVPWHSKLANKILNEPLGEEPPVARGEKAGEPGKRAKAKPEEKEPGDPVQVAGKLLDKVPELKSDVAELKRKGWDIYFDAGDGTSFDPDRIRIADYNLEPADLIVRLAHEVVHAKGGENPYKNERPEDDPETEGKLESEDDKEKKRIKRYVKKVADEDMRGEARAVLRELEVRDILLAAGEPDVLESRPHLKKYDALRKAAAFSRTDPIAVIAAEYSKEKPPQFNGKNYREKYEADALDDYDDRKGAWNSQRDRERRERLHLEANRAKAR